MIKEINLIGSDHLRKKARECRTEVDASGLQFKWDDETREWATHLLETALVHPEAMGISCCQIWDKDTNPLAMFVIRVGTNSWKLYINPSLELSGKKFPIKESCLSEPKVTVKVVRRSNATVTYYDLENTIPKTDKYYLIVTPMPIVIQHEYDHLNGVCLSDYK